MGKSKIRKSEAAPTEESLMQALDELGEAAVKKGDIFANQEPEGGLATQGKKLSDQISRKPASIGGGKVTKMMSASDDCSDDDDSDDSSSDDGSDDARKAEGDDEEDDGAEKSLRDRAEADSVLRKGFRANDFLENFVAVMSDTFEERFGNLAKAVVERYDENGSSQAAFNQKVARALVVMQDEYRTIQAQLSSLQGTLRKALDLPVTHDRPMMLEKGEIVEPHHEERTFHDHPLDGVDTEIIKSWIFQKADQIENEVERDRFNKHVILWENARYNPRALPKHIVKAMTQDLVQDEN